MVWQNTTVHYRTQFANAEAQAEAAGLDVPWTFARVRKLWTTWERPLPMEEGTSGLRGTPDFAGHDACERSRDRHEEGPRHKMANRAGYGGRQFRELKRDSQRNWREIEHGS